MQLPTLAAVLFTAAWSQAGAVVLYDPVGGLPSVQGWTVGSSPTTVVDTLVAGRLRVDTTGNGVSQHGYARAAALDTAAGFVLQFGLQVRSETTDNANRAGFVLLLQGNAQDKSLELAFLDDRVWALQYTPGGPDSGFVQGEGVAFDTASVMRNYTLRVQNDLFALSADGQALLAGALRDYPTISLGTAVYGQRNLLFFGDNTSRASGVFDVGSIVLSPVPEPGAAALLIAGLALLGWRAKKARAAG